MRSQTESMGRSPEMTQMLRLAFLSMVRDLQESMCQMNEQMGSLGRELETKEKGQVEILKPSRTVADRSGRRVRRTGERGRQTGASPAVGQFGGSYRSRCAGGAGRKVGMEPQTWDSRERPNAAVIGIPE